MQKTKKNWTLRIMSLVLMFTLVSTCLLSGTLAKYVTTGTGTDTARVAKWGVEITAGSGLFAIEYAIDDSNYNTIITNSVTSSNADEVVAPGTSGVAASFSITGTPEVASLTTVTVDRGASELNNWEDEAGNAYEPIVWTLKRNGAIVSKPGTDTGTFADLLDNLDSIANAYAPNVDLAAVTAVDDMYVITWDWAFEDSTDPTRDVNDTFLGNEAAEGRAATITLVYDIAVTQID